MRWLLCNSEPHTWKQTSCKKSVHFLQGETVISVYTVKQKCAKPRRKKDDTKHVQVWIRETSSSCDYQVSWSHTHTHTSLYVFPYADLSFIFSLYWLSLHFGVSAQSSLGNPPTLLYVSPTGVRLVQVRLCVMKLNIYLITS